MVSPHSVGMSSRRSKVQEVFAIPRESEGARGGRKVGERGHVPERSRTRKGDHSGRNERLEAAAHGWKRGKEGFICMGCSGVLLAEARQGEIQERYERVEGAASSRV